MAYAKYRMIVNAMVRKIRDGTLPPGTRLPGHLKLARQFKVSTITAERALSELSRIGLVQRRERAGTYVQKQGRALSRIYVVVEGDISRTGLQLQDYWRAILAQAQTHKLPVQIVPADDPNLDEAIGIAGYSGQGIILLGRISQRLAQTAARNSIPCLYLGAVPGRGTFCVLEDRKSAAKELVKTMIDDGCRRVGFVGNLSASNHRLARDGYLEAITPLALGYRYVRDADEGNITSVVQDLLAEDLDVDGVVIMGAHLPVAAMPIVLELKNRVKLGCLTENSTILHFGGVAYVAYYSQIETGKLAFDMLHEIASGQRTEPVTVYSSFKILRPGEKIEG